MAAKILNSTPGSLKSGHSHLKSKGRAIEQALDYKTVNDCRQLSKEYGRGNSSITNATPCARDIIQRLIFTSPLKS